MAKADSLLHKAEERFEDRNRCAIKHTNKDRPKALVQILSTWLKKFWETPGARALMRNSVRSSGTRTASG